MASTLCPDCSQPMRDDMERCPHCYRPCIFPNLNAARRPEEKEALQRRYDAAYATATAAGTADKLAAYESAVAGSVAVISRSFHELQRLCYSEDEVYATFYQRVEAGLRLAGGDDWDRLRSIADTILFGEQNKRQVRFASLSLDGCGLPHYGDCSLVLREEMIAHRATVFEENSVMFMHRHDIHAKGDYAIPVGFRAEWPDRGRLVAAKTKGKAAGLAPATFTTTLQHPGKDERKDVFVEVHIWGSLTIRSIEAVNIPAWRAFPPSPAEMHVVTEKLAHYSVTFSHP